MIKLFRAKIHRSSVARVSCVKAPFTHGRKINRRLSLRRVRKILNTKIFDGEDGKRWSASVVDKQYEILCVSQFTLYHVMKGNKLDFHRSMPGQLAEPFYNNILTELGKKYKPECIKGTYPCADLSNIPIITITTTTNTLYLQMENLAR